MANDPRPPGDVASRTRVQDFAYSYSNPGTSSSSSSQAVFRSYRPTYPYGVRTTLPGGKVFKKATAYTHTSYELDPGGPYRFDGYILGVNIPANRRSVVDYGREVGYLTTLTRSKFGGGLHPSCPQDLQNQAVTKALLEISDQKVNLGEDLATFKQTLSLFSGKTSIMLELLKISGTKKEWRKFFHMHRNSFREPMSAAARSYLEYVYGFKPIMTDIYALNEMMKEQSQKTLLLHGHGSGSRTAGTAEGTWKNLSYTQYRVRSGLAQGKASCHLYARLDPDHSGLRALHQLGLINPWSLAWDLVPFSFIVDWFIPIGSVLEVLTVPFGLIFVDGSLGFRTDETTQYEYRYLGNGVNPVTQTRVTESPMYPVVTCSGYNRIRFGNWPFPGVWVNPDPFSADRPLKALALGIATFSRDHKASSVR